MGLMGRAEVYKDYVPAQEVADAAALWENNIVVILVICILIVGCIAIASFIKNRKKK